MKFVKRFILVILIVLVCVAVGFTLFWQIRKHNANKQLVHKNSTSILKVSVDDIVFDVLLSEINNSSFFDKDSISKDGEKKKWDIGLSIPASMYFFSIDNDFRSLYTYQEIKDEELFLKTITEAFYLDSSDIERDNDRWRISSHSGKVKFVGDSKNVLISLSYSSSMLNMYLKNLSLNDWDVMQDMWKNRSTAFDQVKNIDSLKNVNFDDDLVYLNLKSKDRFSLDFGNGFVKGSANLHSILLKPRQDNKVRKMDEGTIISAYLNLNISPLLVTFKPFFDKAPEAKDFLVKSFGGYADVQWKKGEVTQQDTIVTYDYDDNFEPVEKELVRDEQVPNLTFTFKGSKDLYNLIPNKIFYKVNKNVDNGYLVLSTDVENKSSLDLETSPYFMNFQYHYDESIQKYVSKDRNLEKIKSVSVVGKVSEDGGTLFEGEVKLVDEHLHPIVSLFK